MRRGRHFDRRAHAFRAARSIFAREFHNPRKEDLVMASAAPYKQLRSALHASGHRDHHRHGRRDSQEAGARPRSSARSAMRFCSRIIISGRRCRKWPTRWRTR